MVEHRPNRPTNVRYFFGAHGLVIFFAAGAQGFAALCPFGAHGLAALVALVAFGAQGFAASATVGTEAAARSPPSAAMELKVRSEVLSDFIAILPWG
ncbi:hypothetical protein [Bradyrhizobium hipponense]|uniref:hypothetical protein n=1 Tax=Bradyrhizobium hipponense TaxID=2605638 RepID=UPI001AEF05D1|nr:hypothetical protein [Bradyrhizobium hipponense]